MNKTMNLRVIELSINNRKKPKLYSTRDTIPTIIRK